MINLGDKIEYKTQNKKGDEVWRTGIVHAIKKAEAVTGPDIILGYLVDTGRDERVEEFTFDKRDQEINNRMQKLMQKGATQEEAHAKVIKAADLPKSKIETERVRHPEQVEVAPDNIRARE